ncbi:copper resistance protein B [Thiolapillus sp.]|uniref:Copper resistance protein B n=1 Tax=Thiolapillus brandeum TaxID=1076588 RepID=A0A831WEM1_9GAMM|nr:copper resistance protein B [Thiolapillus sp.]HEC05691.1 copper resistance protein B [Thiolapillus brandeum]
MKKIYTMILALGVSGSAVAGGMNDDPFLFMLKMDKLEFRDTDNGTNLIWDAQAWAGKDLNKLWIKSEGEQTEDGTEEGNVEVLYSRAIAPFWDLQAGWRHDFRPEPSRDWFAFGAKGLAPYLFEVDATAYVGESGRLAAALSVEYEYLFTQKLILSPELEMNLYSKDDEEVGVGSGLSDMELGLRLRYEIVREFAPYIGVVWWGKYGNTADYAKAEGGDTSDVEFVAGFRLWF